MKPSDRTPRLAPLLGGMLLLVTCPATKAQGMQTEAQTIARLEKRIEETYDRLSDENQEVYEAALRKILESLTEEEIRLVAQHIEVFDNEKEPFRMWARFDPAGALKAVRAVEDENAAEIKLSGTGLEGGPGEAMQSYVCELYLGAITGWAEVAPVAAWEAFKERKGPLAKSLVIEDCLSVFYPVLSEQLAKVDPDRAFNELISYRSEDYEDIIVAEMLGGYLRSAPQGRKWREEANRLLEREWRKNGWLHAEIRTALMGRWLQDDATAAEEWFRNSQIEGLAWSYRGDGKDVKIRYDLASAAGYWAARDFPAAWNWMKRSGDFKRAGFGAAVRHGAAVYLTRSSSYFIRGESARVFLLERAAQLPDEQDRKTCVSMIGSADVEANDLHGVPEKAIDGPKENSW